MNKALLWPLNHLTFARNVAYQPNLIGCIVRKWITAHKLFEAPDVITGNNEGHSRTCVTLILAMKVKIKFSLFLVKALLLQDNFPKVWSNAVNSSHALCTTVWLEKRQQEQKKHLATLVTMWQFNAVRDSSGLVSVHITDASWPHGCQTTSAQGLSHQITSRVWPRSSSVLLWSDPPRDGC